MKFIHDTISVCNHCYRHVPGVVYEKDEKIWLTKKCPEHGEMQQVVETDPEFYYNINKASSATFVSLMFEATNKCQLNCPHCYQLPDNSHVDSSLDNMLKMIDAYPEGFVPMVAGAEPTLYNDIIPLTTKLADQYGRCRTLTNGLRFGDKKFAKELLYNKEVYPAVGLNHWSYQGKSVHEKQLRGIENMKEFSTLDDIGYTVESLDHLPEIFEEIDRIADDKVSMVRIRFGSFIGRSSDQQRNYLSKTVAHIKDLLGDELVATPLDDNPYHVMYNWRGTPLRIIQWPDVENIDMEELNTGPWANFHDGPITNFVHQVIMRDAFVNNKQTKLDHCPSYYHINKGENRKYWKTDWQGPVEFSEFDYTIKDPRKKPTGLI
jgi:uncharacterized radical SAM superfamily Fe-S cluster-containing enzyme